jgi:hypothetical protein
VRVHADLGRGLKDVSISADTVSQYSQNPPNFRRPLRSAMLLMPSTYVAYPQVVSRTFASFRAPKSSVFPVQRYFWGGFDSRQLH